MSALDENFRWLKSDVRFSAVSLKSRLIARSDGIQLRCPESRTILFQNAIRFFNGESNSPTFRSSPIVKNFLDPILWGSHLIVTSWLDEAAGVGFPCLAMSVKNRVRFLLTLRSFSVFRLLGNPATENGKIYSCKTTIKLSVRKMLLLKSITICQFLDSWIWWFTNCLNMHNRDPALFVESMHRVVQCLFYLAPPHLKNIDYTIVHSYNVIKRWTFEKVEP